MRPLQTMLFAYFLLVSLVGYGSEVINVVVWDEQQPAQQEAYKNFLGNEIANYLQKQDSNLIPLM